MLSIKLNTCLHVTIFVKKKLYNCFMIPTYEYYVMVLPLDVLADRFGC